MKLTFRRGRPAGAPPARRLKIAYFADPSSPNGWYRATGPMTALAGRGHEVRQVAPTRRRARLELLRGVDVVLVHRQFDESALLIFRYARENGIPLVWDNDDDFAVVPRRTLKAERYVGLRGSRRQDVVRQLVSAADVVTAPSATLLERFAELGARRTLLLENYVRDEAPFLRSGSPVNRLQLGWFGAAEHQVDLEVLPIADAIERTLLAHPHVWMRTFGVRLPIDHPRYEHSAAVPFLSLTGEIAKFDLGLAPLVDNAFNRARSNIKVKEYAAVGVPWLASPVAPYLGLGKREGGLLVPDDGWHATLDRLVRGGGELRKLRRTAGEWGLTQLIGRNATRWEDLFLELVPAGVAVG